MKKVARHTIALTAAVALLAALPAAASAAYLILQPWSSYPNMGVTVSGYQFDPNENATVQVESASDQVTTNGNGAFTTSITIPQRDPGLTEVTASGEAGNASATLYVQGYYPNAWVSSYFAVPGETISFGGNGFTPNEEVVVYGPSGEIDTFTANSSGNFSGQASFTIPFDFRDSARTFRVEGSMTGSVTNLEVVVGSFYPNLNPSTYYVAKNTSMSASAGPFAPGEEVELLVNGSVVAQQEANGSGNVSFNFTTPASGSEFQLTARGTQSNTQSTRTITLMQ